MVFLAYDKLLGKARQIERDEKVVLMCSRLRSVILYITSCKFAKNTELLVMQKFEEWFSAESSLFV